MKLWHINERSSLTLSRRTLSRLFSMVSPEAVSEMFSRFTPPGCYPQCSIQDVYCLLGYVRNLAISVESLPSWNPPVTARRKLPKRQRGESDWHRELKRDATEWLRTEKGVHGVQYEVPFRGGIADVVSSDGRWFVECGATRPSKVWDLYVERGSEDFRLVVFNEIGVTVFSAGPKVRDLWKARDLWRERFIRMLDKKSGSPFV